MNVIMISFVLFLACFAVVGIGSARRKKSTTEDYLLAGRAVNPWLTALSSMSTNNSGYAFIGLVGYAFMNGLHSLWLSVAWILGDLCVWIFVHRRVRNYSWEVDALSVPTLLGADGKDKRNRVIVVCAGLLTLIFLSVYAAAQLKAGSTALTSLLGWDLSVGIWLGAVIVAVYCFSGGIRASIWTDAAQAFIMVFGMGMLVILAFGEVGGIGELQRRLTEIDPALGAWFPTDLKFGFPLYFLGFMAGGFGAIGAPHILIRSMALESDGVFPKTRNIYLSFFVPFVLASAVIGLYTRVILPELATLPADMAGVSAIEASQILTQQAEQSLPLLAIELLPAAFVGMVLAAIFAATLSTADSQILSCSAAVTQDVFPRWRASYLASKIATLTLTGLSLGFALYAGSGVFALVLIAWSALGATLGPILLVRLMRQPLPTFVSVAMMSIGLVTVVIWENSSLAGQIYSLLPGLCFPMVFYAIFRLIKKVQSDEKVA